MCCPANLILQKPLVLFPTCSGTAHSCRRVNAKKRVSLQGLAAAAAPSNMGGSPPPAGGNAAWRRRRSEPAPQPLLRGASGSGIPKIFSGKTFLLTGFEDDQDRRHLTTLLTSNGGRVLDSIPLPQVTSALCRARSGQGASAEVLLNGLEAQKQGR